MSFEFEDLYIPEDYKFVRFACVANKDNAPNGATNTNCLPFRVRVLSLTDTSDYTSFDDDECKTFNNGGNYVIYANAITVSSVIDAVEKIETLDSKITNHTKDDSIHITSELKNKISQIESTTNQHSTIIPQVQQDLNDCSSSISDITESIKVLGIEKTEVQSADFDTPISNDYINEPNEMHLCMAIVGKDFFPSGKITKVELPYEYGTGA